MHTLSSRKLAIALFASGICGLGGIAQAKTAGGKPGLWKTTISISMPGVPVTIPPVTTTSCLTEKDLVPSVQQPGQDCKVIKQKIVGSKVTWSVSCKDQEGRTVMMDGEGSYKDDTFSGTMQMTMTQGKGPAQKMSMKITSKWTGPCKKEKVSP